MNGTTRTTLVASVILLAGCATSSQVPEPAQVTHGNPPPSEAFAQFNAFELKPINTTESCTMRHGGEVALGLVQERLNEDLGKVISGWNAAATTQAPARKLVIEPVCLDVRMVGTQGRIWGGALAGSSLIEMKVRYVDAATGKMVAEPKFFQRASAMGAAWTFGATDRSMPSRIAELISDYTIKNYQHAVGGPTGL